METYSILTTLEERECSVTFFAGWGSYSHPITPTQALTWEDALQRENYYCAWMCQEHGEARFVLFQRIVNQREWASEENQNTDLRPGIYDVEKSDDQIFIGKPLDPKEAFLQKRFFYKATPNDKLELLTPYDDLTYRYSYNKTGVPEAVQITNPDGVKSILKLS